QFNGWDPGFIDVGDLMRIPAEQAARILAHEFDEQTCRQQTGAGFDVCHPAAQGPENRVAGATRLESSERKSSPDVPNATGAWWWLMPYRLPDGVSIRAILFRGAGRNNVVSGQYISFPNSVAYQSYAVPAR